MEENKKVIIILSGGLDSTTLLYDLVYQGFDVHAISFNYGQKHARELNGASLTCKGLGVDHKIVDLSVLGTLIDSALTNDEIDVPEGHYAAENMSITVVPGRNLIFLSIAAGYAASIGASGVYLGTHAGDHAIYPDCRPKFNEAMKQVLKLFDNNTVELHAPYSHIDKTQVVTRGLRLEVDYSLTWTCYKGKDKAWLEGFSKAYLPGIPGHYPQH